MSAANSQKIALITGANKGLGLETAKQLSARGVFVLLASRDLARGEAAAKSLGGESAGVRAVKLDVAKEADRDAIAKSIEKEFGRLDVLINNAGVMTEPLGGNNTSTVDLKLLRDTFEVNFFATVALTQKLLPLLRKSEAGRIVNLSSILGSLTLHATAGSPIYEAKQFAYDASKAALNMFTIHLAHELRGTKIKVNSAHPGWVKTDMGGENAPMEIVDGAKTSVQLATVAEDGPTGGYFHMGELLPW